MEKIAKVPPQDLQNFKFLNPYFEKLPLHIQEEFINNVHEASVVKN